MTREKAIKIIKEFINGTCLHLVDQEALETLIPELIESEDERVRKSLIEFLTQIKEISESGRTTWTVRKGDAEMCKSSIAYLEKQKENIDKEYVFRPLAGTDINSAVLQAIRRADEGDRLVLAFNGAYIPVRKGCNANKIVDIYDGIIEKQKDASKAIEVVDRIDKYIDEHLANAHDMKDSNPDKKYYRGWDDALGEMAGILQDVYSGEKQKEQNPIKWTDLTWKDIVELEGIINNVHYDFSAGIGQESFGKEVLERFRSTKGIEYLDEAEQKCWRIVLPQPHYAFEEGQKEQKLNPDKEKLIRHCIGLILTDATDERFKDYGLTLKDCLTWLGEQKEQKPVCEDCAMYLSGNCIHPNGKCENVKSKQEWSEEEKGKVAEYLHERDGGMLWSRAKDITDDILDILRPQKLDASKLDNFDPVEVLNRIKKEWPMAWEKVVGKQEWGEEDKKMLLSIINAFRNGTVSTIGQEQWLKNLSERFNLQPKQEWSDEDKAHIDSLLKRLDGMCKNGATFTQTRFAVSEDMDWLKSLQNRWNSPKSNTNYPSWKPTGEQKYDGNMDNECIKLCNTLNSIPSIDTFESCCGHLKDRYSIWFFCNDIITISRLGRCVERNYSDGKWELLVDSTDTHPTGVFCLRSKVPFQDYDEMEESVNELCNGIQYWFNTKFDSYFNGDSSSWKPSEHQMTILKAVKDYVGKGSGYWGEALGSLIDDLEKLT